MRQPKLRRRPLNKALVEQLYHVEYSAEQIRLASGAAAAGGALLGLAGLTTDAQAATFTVTNLNDSGAGSLRQAILDADPAHVEAKGAVTQIAFLQRATAQSPDAVAASDAAPDDIDLAFAAADVQLFQRDIHGAFNRLIALVKKTAGDDRTRVRTRLISLFELFDAADPEVIAGRRNLANALY